MDLRLYKRCPGYHKIDPYESDHVYSTSTLDEDDKLEKITTYSGLNMNKNVLKRKKSKHELSKSYSNSLFTIDGECNPFEENKKPAIKFDVSADVDNLMKSKGVEANSQNDDNPESLDSITLASSKHVLQTQVETKRTFLKNKTNIRGFSMDNNEESSDLNSRVDKTSYCRPVTKHSSQDFVRKALERNFKLQILLKKLVLARQKEKHNEIWNKYINELRKKHRYYDYQPSETSKHQAKFCSGTETNIANGNIYALQDNFASVCKTVSSYASNIYCYPTAAEGRLMMLNHGIATKRASWQCEHGKKKIVIEEKAKLQNNTSNRKPHNKIWQSHGSISTTDKTQQFDNDQTRCPRCSGNSKVEMKPIAQQTGRIDSKYRTYSKTGIECNIHDNANLGNRYETKNNPLANIEKKLDSLIKSFNAFAAENRTKKMFISESTNTRVDSCGCEQRQIKSNKESCLLLQAKRDFTCAVAQESESIFIFPHRSCSWKDAIDTFSHDEDSKSDQIKRDIDEILTKSSIKCSNPVQLPVEVPTKDFSIKVSESALATHRDNSHEFEKEVRVEEMFIADDSKFMTIAVNTDPLGLSALIRVSADTVRQILSYMPSIDCSCLLRQTICASSPNRDVISHYVCNICGASFLRPSQLSNHIQRHNLGNSRHCCVCKQLVELEGRCSNLFACQHCGQVFTRAYCRELHEQTCARTVGKKHDVTSSRILLR